VTPSQSIQSRHTDPRAKVDKPGHPLLDGNATEQRRFSGHMDPPEWTLGLEVELETRAFWPYSRVHSPQPLDCRLLTRGKEGDVLNI